MSEKDLFGMVALQPNSPLNVSVRSAGKRPSRKASSKEPGFDEKEPVVEEHEESDELAEPWALGLPTTPQSSSGSMHGRKGEGVV